MVRRYLFLIVIWGLFTACSRSAADGPEPLPGGNIPTPTITFQITSTSTPKRVTSVSSSPTPSPTQSLSIEYSIQPIALAGEIAQPSAEISGLAWYSDTLILLPQYPSRFDEGDGAVFGISSQQIVAYLAGENQQPIEPFAIPIVAPDVKKIPGYEGFEAIAFHNEQVFLTIEVNPGKTYAYLVQGQIAPDLSQMTIDTDKKEIIQSQTGISNMSDEAILVAGSRIITFYEANGKNVNPNPQAHLFNFKLNPQDNLSFPNLEYRLTDATAMDANGRFWVINYFFPGDTKLEPAKDPIAQEYPSSPSHASSEIVERLLEYHFTENGLALTDSPPIWLELETEARNWEGIARLEVDDFPHGFLLATDKFPSTILAYIPNP